MWLNKFKSTQHTSYVICTVIYVTFYHKHNGMLHTKCDVYLASGPVKHFFYKNSCCKFLVNTSTSDVCQQQAGADCRAGAGPTDGDSNARLSDEPFYPA
jgi:hypothetical protein